jgi:putative redox protein
MVPAMMPYVAERVSFESSTGPRLAGLVDRPSGAIRGWGLYAHGFTLGKDCPAAARICKQLAADGIAMLRFDNLGLGDSEGDWGDGSFTVKVADTRRALAFLTERGTPADLLVGHSWGGAAAIAAASQEPTVRAVVTIGAPSDPRTVEHQYDAVVNRAVSEGHAEWLVGGRALTLKRAFVEDVRQAHLLDVVPTLRRPLLVMHSPTDDTVDIANAADIFNAARHPRSFVSLEGSDHLLTAHGQAARAARIIGAWADPYLSGASA